MHKAAGKSHYDNHLQLLGNSLPAVYILYGYGRLLMLRPEISQGAGKGSTIFLLFTLDTAIRMASVLWKPVSRNKAGRELRI